MSCRLLIVGVPAAATCAPEKTWRAAADLVRGRLRARFGVDVVVEYAELFTPDMAAHPAAEALVADGSAVPPVVLLDGVLVSSGGKLNVSAIERAVQARLEGAVASHG